MDDAYNALAVRLGSLEDVFVTNLHRNACNEHRTAKFARLISNLESRIDREQQRRRAAEETQETQPTAVAPSHSGEGAVSPALAARSSPPGSVTLTAGMADGAPLYVGDAQASRQPETVDIAPPVAMPSQIKQVLQQLQRLDFKQNTADELVNSYDAKNAILHESMNALAQRVMSSSWQLHVLV